MATRSTIFKAALQVAENMKALDVVGRLTPEVMVRIEALRPEPHS